MADDQADDRPESPPGLAELVAPAHEALRRLLEDPDPGVRLNTARTILELKIEFMKLMVG